VSHSYRGHFGTQVVSLYRTLEITAFYDSFFKHPVSRDRCVSKSVSKFCGGAHGRSKG